MSKVHQLLDWCTEYHCLGDCGLSGHGTQHKNAAKTNAERQRDFRARKAALQIIEVRGIFAHAEKHAAIKEFAAKLTRNNSQSTDKETK